MYTVRRYVALDGTVRRVRRIYRTDKVFQCPYCNTLLHSRAAFLLHVAACHPDKVPEAVEK